MHPGRSESRAPQPCGRHGRWMRRAEDSERQRCPEVPREGPSSCGRPPALLPTPDGLAAPRGRGLPRSQNARRETTRRTRVEAVFPFPSPFGLLEVARQPGLCSTCLASFSRGPFPHADLAGAVQEGCGRPSPPLPSPPLGPGLASAPGCLFRGGRAAWCRLWPFVRKDEPGTCSAGCGFACGCRARLCHRAVLVRGRPPCSAAAAGGWEGGQVRGCASPPSPVGPAGGWRHLSEATRVARASCRLTSDAGTFCCEPGTGPGASPRGPLI